jgi:lipoprotein-anchoring transpeptidase ErfK/SrfK
MVRVGNRRKVLFSVVAAFAATAFARASEAAKFQLLGGMPGSDGIPADNGGSANISGAVDTSEGSPSGEIISFSRGLAPGSILVKTGERKLYYVLPDNKAMVYRVGVGKEGFSWSGSNRISRKAEWPEWRPPPAMIAREAKKGRFLPEMMPGGGENPLGARAIYIGATQYRIHGTTQRWSIGRAVSSGCIRMLNEDVIDLYNRVRIGATVIVES